jgi:phosphonate transport system substrate-binding protein
MKALRTLFATAALIALPATLMAADANPDTLKIALLPDESPSTIIKDNQGLKHYLEHALHRRIELVVTTDYSSMIEAARFERIDLAYFGPLSYVLAKKRANIEAFAAKKKGGATVYHSVLIANRASGIRSIDDIAGHDVAWGDPASTSSHLIPASILKDHGLEAGKDYREHYTGSHDAVALAVQQGNAQAGGLSQPIFESMLARGLVSKDKVLVLQISKAYPEYPWTMRSDLAPDLKASIRQAFLRLDDPAVLKPLKADGFGAVTDTDYDVVRDLSRKMNL